MLGSSFVFQALSSRCSTWSSDAISSGVGTASRSRRAAAEIIASQACRDPVDFLAGQLLARGSCRRHPRAPSRGTLRCRACRGALSKFFSAAPDPSPAAPLGGDVDGARRVQFDHDRAAATTAPTAADGLKPSAGVSQASAVTAGAARRDRRPRCPTAARAPSAGRSALVAAEPPHLGHQLLHVGDALSRNLIHPKPDGSASPR